VNHHKGYVAHALDARAGQLEKRIMALEAKAAAFRYCGVWDSGVRYVEGNFATHGGSLWHANHATSARPGIDST